MTEAKRGAQTSGALSEGGAFEARPWGGFCILEEGPGYKVKRLVVEPGHRLSLQRHRFRAEHWVVIAGSPRVIVGGRARRLKPKGAVTVPKGAWHRIENPGKTPAVIIEVQHGLYLGEDDIIRRRDDYGRLGDAKGARPPADMPPGEVAPPPPALGAEQPAAEPLAARRGFPGRSTRGLSRNRVSETRRSRTAR
jgi:mannose-6-phosphate isomerase